MISIIVPVYNAEAYLNECLESIVGQSFQNLEIILIDDGSEDKSGEICDHYKELDSRIQVFHQKNAGVSNARNCGIEISRGEQICFIDSDDYVEVDYIELLYKYFSFGGMSACRMRNGGESLYTDQNIIMSPDEAQISCFSSQGMGGCVWGKLYDAKVIKDYRIRFDEDIAICEDLLFVTKYLQHATNKIVWNKSEVYFYRFNEQSAINGRYQTNHAFTGKETTEITALERCGEYLLQNNKELVEACLARTVKAATNTLRTMAANGVEDMESITRLRRIIRGNIVKCIKTKHLSSSSKISIVLSAISPELELFIRKL